MLALFHYIKSYSTKEKCDMGFNWEHTPSLYLIVDRSNGRQL